MARGIFGGRKGPRQLDGATQWPLLPGAAERGAGDPGLDMPAVAYAMSTTSTGAPDALAATAHTELLSRIAAVRDDVADALFGMSKDYQILCSLVHENLEACNEPIEELRRRLADNLHYTVLAKLDEVHALVEAHIAAK